MITFVEHPEIPLFANFTKRFADVELLRDRTESITIVIPTDYLAGVFYVSDPFAYNNVNNGSIWYNEPKVNELGLNQEECYACIAHELGHMLDDSNLRDVENQQDREIYADRVAYELELGNNMISALRKMIDYYQQSRESEEENVCVEKLQERIEVLSKYCKYSN